MIDRDPQRETLEERIQKVERSIDSNQKWLTIATVTSVCVAVIAVVLSGWVYYGSAKREADVAASEALMRHFEFAAQHPKSKMSEMVADHGIYTANIIVDLTDAPGERLPWRSTARGLLKKHEDDISTKDLRCNELDEQFETLVKGTLHLECKNGEKTSPRGRWPAR